MKQFFKTFALHLASSFLVLGIFVAYAISYPTTTPAGETAGGRFMDYFNKILVSTGAGSDGTVRQSAQSTSLGTNSNPSVVTLSAGNVQVNGTITSNGIAKAPVFQDSDDTGFFANPNNVSHFNRIDFDHMFDRNNYSYFLDLNNTSGFNTINAVTINATTINATTINATTICLNGDCKSSWPI